MRCTWHGVFPAAVTHFKDDQSLDLPALLGHLDVMIQAGVHGLILLGTVGENASLEYPEKLDVLKAAVAHVRKRVPVLTGVAESSTRLACRFAADAAKIGADGLMVLPAMVYKAMEGGMAHFRASGGHGSVMVTTTPYLRRGHHAGDVRGAGGRTDARGDWLVRQPAVTTRRSSSATADLFCGVDDQQLGGHVGVGWVSGLVAFRPKPTFWDRRPRAMPGAGRLPMVPLSAPSRPRKLVQYIKPWRRRQLRLG
jgi:4-hydroxy-tetrahydrodipicolinate synthase